MRILLAVDGSPESKLGIQLLAHFGVIDEVLVLHAISLPDLDHPLVSSDIRHSVLEEVENKIQSEGQTFLDQITPTLSPNCALVRRLQRLGSPSTLILETAEEEKVDLVIVGARGLTPLQEFVLGSVSQRVLLHATCPTLVMKAPWTSLNHIVIPVEGEGGGEAILHFLTSLPFLTLPKLTLVTVWSQPRLPWPIMLGTFSVLEDHVLGQAQEMLDRLASQLQDKGFSTSTMVELGDPTSTILNTLQKLSPDLIVMGSHGRKGLSRFVLGSVSHTLVHQAKCPVLVIR